MRVQSGQVVDEARVEALEQRNGCVAPCRLAVQRLQEELVELAVHECAVREGAPEQQLVAAQA